MKMAVLELSYYIDTPYTEIIRGRNISPWRSLVSYTLGWKLRRMVCIVIELPVIISNAPHRVMQEYLDKLPAMVYISFIHKSLLSLDEALIGCHHSGCSSGLPFPTSASPD